MKKSNYSEERVVYAMRLVNSDAPFTVVSRTATSELSPRVCTRPILSKYLMLQIIVTPRRGASHADP